MTRTTGIRIAFVIYGARTDRPMSYRHAQRIEAARSDARIHTLVTQASPIRCAVLMDDTLRSTLWRSSEHSSIARTHSGAVRLTAHRIRTAWAGPAWIRQRWNIWWRFGQHNDARAADKSVSGVLRWTVAHRRVVDGLAQRIVAACAGFARIDALLLRAYLIRSTVGVVDALRMTSGQRISEESLQAHTGQCFALFATLGVRTASDIGARRLRRRLPFDSLQQAMLEWIAVQTGRTATLGAMVLHRADGILAARARARITAALAEARTIETAIGAGHTFGTAQRIAGGVRTEARITDGHVAVHIANAVDGAR